MAQLSEKQRELLDERRIASVATIGPDGAPHLTSVWFLYENEHLYLAIPSSSVKGKNLAHDRRIAVMIDVRVSFREMGLTAIGEAELIGGEAAAVIAQRVHAKYLKPDALSDPRVGPLFAAVDDLVVKLVPSKWICWDMSALDQQAFGGAVSRSGYLKDIDP